VENQKIEIKMQRLMLKSKIHRAKITDANLYYEGSFTIDEEILEKANILPYEQVSVVNINNGERFETYVIPGTRGNRDFCLNGAAARKGAPGDEVIIISYSIVSEEELVNYKPLVILLDENNNIAEITNKTEPNKLIGKK
jgi:aspartate 1-decarboxylase